MMKKNIVFFMVILAMVLTAQPAWSKNPYKITNSQLLSIKDITDDPTPFYTKTNYLKDLLPPEVWDMCVYDVDEMKRLWPEVVGFKAPEIVGDIAPEIKPGNYSLTDKDKLPFKDLMPEYFYNKFNEPGDGPYPNTIGNFTDFEIIPTRQYYRTLPLAKAAKQHMGTVKQTKDGYIIHDSYTGGLPFPRPSGEHKAIQIIYNYIFAFGFANWDSTVMLDNVIGVNKNWKIDHKGTGVQPIMSAIGRVQFEPYGWFDKRAEQQKESTMTMYSVKAPRDIYGNKYSGVGYILPEKESITLAYVNILRRVRKLSSSDRQDQAVGQDITFDDAWGFQQQLSPTINPYDYKILEEREYLVPTYTLVGDSYLDSKENFKYKNLQFERRPVWVVEMKQKDPNYIYSKRIWYVDKETLMPLLWLCYDQKDRLYRTFVSFFGFIPQMGVVQFFQFNNEDFIDTHSTFSWSTCYPNPYLERSDVSFKGMMKAK
jgi:hypothetical protein